MNLLKGKGGIYRIVNKVNGKCYVGSAKDFHIRKCRHLCDLRKGTLSSIKLQRAFNKYGEVNFYFEVVEELPDDKQLRFDAEDAYMLYYDSKANGYNIAPACGGDLLTGNPNRDDIIARMSTAMRLRYANMTPEERERLIKYGEDNPNWRPWTHRFCTVCGDRLRPSAKMTCGDCRDRTGENNPFYGKHHSVETKEKIRQHHLNNPRRPENAKYVSADGMIFETAASAARHFGISNGLVTYRVKSDKYDWFYINAERLSKGDDDNKGSSDTE